MEVFVRNQAEEQMIETICQAWARKFPERYNAYVKQIQRENEQLWRSDGMTKDGFFAYEGQIPRELWWEIYRRFPHAFKTPKILFFIHKLLMGRHKPKPRNSFHIIEKKK